MMSEANIRKLLATLNTNLKAEASQIRAVAFSGGVAALEMVLGEGDQ